MRRSTIWLFTVLVALVTTGSHVTAQSTDQLKFQNPVITVNFPDPFIMEVDGTYYAYSTNSNSRNVPVATSTDLVNWKIVRDVMPALAPWVKLSRSDVWAPEIIRVEDKYLLYYTARSKETGIQSIGLAISDSPMGPFRDTSDKPFIAQDDEGGSIDANPFRDADGTLYLYWKNDGNDRSLPTYIYGQQLSPDGLTLIGEPVRLVTNDQPWKGPLVEAPTMWLRDGKYYMFYSANFFASEKYAVGYAICESPLGPCEDAEENPILASVMDENPVVGPGHQTVFEDASGQTWLIYHAWQVSAGRRTDSRQVWIDRLVWQDDRPVVEGPTRELQVAPITATGDAE